MLQNIRDNSQGILAKIIIGLVIAVFALFSVDTIVGTILSDSSVAEINGVDIEQYELDYEVQLETQVALQRMGENGDPSQLDEVAIRQQALNRLIEQELLYQATQRAGMKVSNQILDTFIAQEPNFQIDGVFNNERAQALINSMGHTPSTYRNTLEKETLLNQLVTAYSESNFMTSGEISYIAELGNQKRDFRNLVVNASEQLDKIEVSEGEIQAYYESNQLAFMKEEQLAVEYLALDKNAIRSEVDVSEEAVQAQYQAELEDFQSKIERRASHILLEVNQERSEAQAISLADEITARLEGGEDFAALAAEFSDDLGSAQDGGDVGYTTGDSFVEEFEAALSQLAVDEVSGPVLTDFGVHLVKLTEQSNTEFASFEESRERIANDLRSGEVDRLYLARLEELGNLTFESPDLSYPAEMMGLEINQTELFGRNGGAGIAANPAVVNQAFNREVLEDGLNSEVIEIDSSSAVALRVIDHQLPQVLSFDEVRADIENLLRAQKIREQAKNTGQQIIAAIGEGEDVTALLEDNGLTWTEHQGVQRSSPEFAAEFVDKLFQLPKPQDNTPYVGGFELSSGDYVVVEITQVTPGTEEDFSESELQSLRTFVSRQGGGMDFEAFVANLKLSAEIDY